MGKAGFFGKLTAVAGTGGTSAQLLAILKAACFHSGAYMCKQPKFGL